MSRTNQISWRWLECVAACSVMLSLFVLAGCGVDGPPKIYGSVKITVTYDGKPVTEGTVSMIEPDFAKGANGQLGSDGTLSLPEVEVGNYVVSVAPPDPPDAVIDDPNPPSTKTYDNIPEQFHSEASSTLKAEVKEGENIFTFELKE